MNIYALSILIIVTSFKVQNVLSSLDAKDIRNHLGTRTPYRFKLNKNDSRVKYPGE